MDRTDSGTPSLSQVVNRRLAILGRRAKRNENRLSILSFIFRQQAVMTPGKSTELLVRLDQILENRFNKVIPASDDTLHIVLLVLYGTQQHRIS